MEIYNIKAAFTELEEFCPFGKNGSFMEVTQWKNGDGFTVHINNNRVESFGLTYGEFDALKKLVEELDKQL